MPPESCALPLRLELDLLRGVFPTVHNRKLLIPRNDSDHVLDRFFAATIVLCGSIYLRGGGLHGDGSIVISLSL